MYADVDYVVASNNQRSMPVVAVLSNDITKIGWRTRAQKFLTMATFKAEVAYLYDVSTEVSLIGTVFVFL